MCVCACARARQGGGAHARVRVDVQYLAFTGNKATDIRPELDLIGLCCACWPALLSAHFAWPALHLARFASGPLCFSPALLLALRAWQKGLATGRG